MKPNPMVPPADSMVIILHPALHTPRSCVLIQKLKGDTVANEIDRLVQVEEGRAWDQLSVRIGSPLTEGLD